MRATFLGLALAVAIFDIAACSDSDDTIDLGSDAGDSAPSQLPSSDASDANPATDASVDADADAEVRICSDDQFCHSVVPPNEELHGVWGDGAGTIWSVSTAGDILRWDGNAWNVHAKGLGALAAVWGSSPTDVWVGGAAGLFHGTGASAAALVFAPSPNLPGDPTYAISSIWGTGPHDIWAVGNIRDDFNNAGRVLHYAGPGTGADAGADAAAYSDWTLDPLSDQPYAFGTVWGTPEGGAWIQGAGFDFDTGAVYHRKVGTTTWAQVTLPPGGSSNDFAPNGDVFSAAGASTGSSIWLYGRTGDFNAEGYWHGTSTDNGATVTFTFTEKPFGGLGLNAIWGLGVNDTWGVGPSGRVAHWDGAKWMQAAILTERLPVTASFYGIWGTSNDDFWVVGDNIALHKTTKGAP